MTTEIITTTQPTSASHPLSSDDANILTAAKGSGITFIGTLFEYVGRFVLGILLARFMGADQYGLYSLALTTQSILVGIVLLGLGASVVRYVSLH